MADDAKTFLDYLRRPGRKRFSRLVGVYYSFVWSVALRATGHPDDAVDLTHDLFLSLLLQPPAAGNIRSPRGYLATRTLTLARRARQSAERRLAREHRAARRIARSEGIEDDEAVESLRFECARLPGRLRDAVELRYLVGLRNREVAAALGVSERSVEDDLRRGRELLRSRMKSEVSCVFPWLAGMASVPECVIATTAPPPASLCGDLERLAEVVAAVPNSATAGAFVGGWMMKKAIVALGLAVALVAFTGYWLLPSREDVDVVPPDDATTPVVTATDGVGSGADDSGAPTSTPLLPANATTTAALAVVVVWDDTRAPVAGATVTLARLSAPADASVVGVTADDGAVGMTYPATWNRARLHARLDEEAESEALRVELPSETLTLLLRRPTQGRIRGRVLDAETREPIAAATITIQDGKTTVADANGTYALDPKDQQSVRLIVRADGYLEVQEPVEVATEAEFKRDFLLDPTLPFEVQVVDEERQPIEGVSILRAQLDGSYLGSEPSRQLTDASGVAVMEHMSRLKPQQLQIKKEGYKSTWRRPPAPTEDADAGEFTVVLFRKRLDQRLVRGRVVDEDGAGLAGIEVSWAQTWGGPDKQDAVTSGDDGVFELRFRTDHDTCHVLASAPGWAPAIVRKVSTGSPEEPTEVELQLEAAHWLEGEIVDVEGEPVEGARVKALPDTKLLGAPSTHPVLARQATTDERGWFRLTDLSSATVAIEVRGPSTGSWSTLVEDTVGVDRRVRWTLRRPGVIRGRVTDGESGDPVTAFNVKLKPVGDGWPRGLWYPRTKEGESFGSAEGVFLLKDVPHSHRYDIVVEADGYVRHVSPAVVPMAADSTDELSVKLGRGARFSGRVVSEATGQPVGGAQLLFAEWDRRASLSDSWSWKQRPNFLRARTAEDGSFAFLEDEPGTLLIIAKGYARLVVPPAERDAYPGSDGEGLLIRLRAGASLQGVYFEDGKPKPSAHVDLLIVDETKLSWQSLGASRTDADGAFGWESLAPLGYRIHYYREAESSGPEKRPALRLIGDVELVAGEARSMTFGDALGALELRGRVTDAAGNVLTSGEISLAPRFRWKYSELCTGVQDAEDGRFHLQGLSPGKYAVSIISRVGRRALREIELHESMEMDFVVGAAEE